MTSPNGSLTRNAAALGSLASLGGHRWATRPYYGAFADKHGRKLLFLASILGIFSSFAILLAWPSKLAINPLSHSPPGKKKNIAPFVVLHASGASSLSNNILPTQTVMVPSKPLNWRNETKPNSEWNLEALFPPCSVSQA